MSNETKKAAGAASGARVRRDYETRAAAIRERENVFYGLPVEGRAE